MGHYSIHFSPTGGTRRVADILVEGLQGEYQQIDLCHDTEGVGLNENDVCLDPFMGSGTTAIACIKEHRHFIGFELNKEYFDKAVRRIKAEQAQLTLF